MSDRSEKDCGPTQAEKSTTLTVGELLELMPEGRRPAVYCHSLQQNYVDGWNACLRQLRRLAADHE